MSHGREKRPRVYNGNVISVVLVSVSMVSLIFRNHNL